MTRYYELGKLTAENSIFNLYKNRHNKANKMNQLFSTQNGNQFFESHNRHGGIFPFSKVNKSLVSVSTISDLKFTDT